MSAISRLFPVVDTPPVCPECGLPMQFVPADDQGDAASPYGEWRTTAGYACDNLHFQPQETTRDDR